MDNYLSNESIAELANYETPFADVRYETEASRSYEFEQPFATSEFETPFTQTFEFNNERFQNHPLANDYISLLAELHDHAFDKAAYEMATELEDKFTNESPGAISYYTIQQAQEYFQPLRTEAERILDEAASRFSGNNFADQSEAEVEHYFNELEMNRGNLSPAQEQFLGGLLKKVKSVVSTGINLAKKGISFIGSKVLGPILNKLKGVIMPLLQKVLQHCLGKVPVAFRPYAKMLAKKFLNLDLEQSANESTSNESETEFENESENEIGTTSNIGEIQSELDNHIAHLVFSESVSEAENLVSNYGASAGVIQGESYETSEYGNTSIDNARKQFVNELQNLKPGDSPAPAIERFLPVLAVYPIIKGVIAVVGRDKIIGFLAGMLAKLIGKYVPEQVSKPLASTIIDIGARLFGFETPANDKERTAVAYEAIANTIQETIHNLNATNEAIATDHETATAQVLEAFEKAAANNFPAQYIKEGLRPTVHNGLWILRPGTGDRSYYKKYSKIFDVTIEPQIAKKIVSFRGLPLANFLHDKLGVDTNKPIQVKVHLYEAIEGSWLSRISRSEKHVYGLGRQPGGWLQFHPLSMNAAALLLKEPGLGRNFSSKYTINRHHIAIGQRFFYLEIPGYHLRLNPCTCPYHHRHVHPQANGSQVAQLPGGATYHGQLSPGGISPHSQPSAGGTPYHPHPAPGGVSYHPLPAPASVPARVANSSDIQAVINFIKSEIRFNYYFSEEDAKSIVEKLNRNDFIGAAMTIRASLRNVLHSILVKNIPDKVKIVHEMVPELYTGAITGEQENIQGGIVLNAGKALLSKIVDKLIAQLLDHSVQAVIKYFKARAYEFKQAQASVHDGVTLKIIWSNISGMSSIRAIISAIRGKMSIGSLADLALPNIPTPEVKVSTGKKFD